MAEFDAVRITAVLTADTELDVGLGLAAFGDGDLDELTDAGLVQSGEGVLLEDLVLGVGHQEAAHVVTAHAESGLGEIVGAEAEELRRFGDLISRQCSTRHFNHGANEIIELHFFLAHHFFRNFMHDFDLEVEFFLKADERNHDLRLHLDLLLQNIRSGFEDRTRLHFRDLRICDAETAAAMSEHRIELVQGLHASGDFFNRDAHLLGKFCLGLLVMRNELVKRRIKQTNRRGQSFKSREDASKVLTLIRKEFRDRGFAVGEVVREDHLTNGVDAVTFKEHVFRAGEADALRTECDGVLRLLRSVGVRADLKAGGLGAPAHELVEALELLSALSCLVSADHAGDDLGMSGFELASVNDAAGAVDGEIVTFIEGLTCNGDRLLVVVDVESSGTADAHFTHLTGNKSRVGGNATARGEDAFRSDHATKIFRAGLIADEENLLTFLLGDDGTVGVEVDLARSGTRTGWKTRGDGLGLLHLGKVEDRSEKLLELIGRIAQHGGLPVDELFLHHVDGELQSGGCSALAVAGLKHEQFAFLHSELDVLHVFEMLFKRLANFHQLGIRLRHFLLQLGHWLRSAHASHDVFALGVDEELPVELVDAVGRVTREGHAGTGSVAGIAEDHCLHIHGGAPLGGDAIFAAVNDRAIVHP